MRVEGRRRGMRSEKPLPKSKEILCLVCSASNDSRLCDCIEFRRIEFMHRYISRTFPFVVEIVPGKN